MQIIEYDRSSLVANSLVTLVLCPILGVGAMMVGGFGYLLGLILIVGGPLAATKTVWALFGDATALRFDQRQVTIFAKTKGETFQWGDVLGVDIETMTTRMYGVIPVSRIHSLVFRVNGGLLGTRKLRLPLKLMALRKEQGVALVAELDRVRHGAPNLAPILARRLGEQQGSVVSGDSDAPQNTGFDPDAIMARYLSQRDQGAAVAQDASPPPPQMPARVAGFGRKGA